MSLQRQPGFFDVDDRAGKLTALGDPLVKLKAEIDFTHHCDILETGNDSFRFKQRKKPDQTS